MQNKTNKPKIANSRSEGQPSRPLHLLLQNNKLPESKNEYTTNPQ